MEIAFHDKKLRQLCESSFLAERELGEAIASVLKHRIADMCAADAITDLPTGKPYNRHELHRDEMALPLHDGAELIFCANHRNPPLLSTGEIDWRMVNRIKILRIEK